MVAELPGELLTNCVLKGGAAVLVRMLCVCKAWRTVLNAQGDGLWEMLALKRFPRLRLILRHAPAQHPFRIIYSQQLAAEQAASWPAHQPPPPLSGYIFLLEWRAHDGLVGSWCGEVSNLTSWLPVHWAGPSAGLSRMRSDLRTYFAAGADVVDESDEAFEQRYELWTESDGWTFMKSFTVSVSVTRRSDLATAVLLMPEDKDDQDIYDNLDDSKASVELTLEQDYSDRPMCRPAALMYGVLDDWHLRCDGTHANFQPRHAPHAEIELSPSIRIGSREFAETGITVDAMRLGFQKRIGPAGHGSARLEELPLEELLRYLAYHAPWGVATAM